MAEEQEKKPRRKLTRHDKRVAEREQAERYLNKVAAKRRDAESELQSLKLQEKAAQADLEELRKLTGWEPEQGVPEGA